MDPAFHRTFRRALTAAAFTVVATAAAAGAAMLFGADAADSCSNVYLIDSATGASTLIGDAGAAITGLAFQPSTGVLYGSTAVITVGQQSIPAGALVTVNTTTGAATLVGSFGLQNGTLADLSFDPASGVLYGWRTRSDGDLYTVNLTTGAATLVGESGLTLTGGNGLTFGPGGALFLAGEGTQGALRTIDKTTGQSIGSVALSGYPSSENINSLAFDGVALLGVTNNSHTLIRIDPVTGAITTIGPAGTETPDTCGPAVDAIAEPVPGPTTTTTSTTATSISSTTTTATTTSTTTVTTSTTRPTTTTVTTSSTTTTVAVTTTTIATTTTTTTPGPGSCPATPAAGCRAPAVSRKGLFELRQGRTSAANLLRWRWQFGAATTLAEFGDPLHATAYQLCAYDAGGLRIALTVPPGGTCDHRPCWTAGTKTFRYRNRTTGENPLTDVILRAGAVRKATVTFAARGPSLAVPSLPLTLPITVQLHAATDVCWETKHSTAGPDTARMLRSRSD